MARETAEVRAGHLFPDGTGSARPVCAVGSSTWFDWLEEGETFAYLLPRGYRATVYRRQSGNHRYWYASLKRHTKTYNAYGGKSDGLTAERLADVGARLLEKADGNGRSGSAPRRRRADEAAGSIEDVAAAVAQELGGDLLDEVAAAGPGFLFLSLAGLEMGHLSQIEDVLHAHGRGLKHWRAEAGKDDTFRLSITTEEL